MLKIAVFVAIVACVYGSSFYKLGACPDGKGAGDRWIDQASCMECYCDITGYGCSGCDTLTPVIGCYQTVNTTLMYPECCPRLVCLTLNGLGDLGK